MSLQLLAKQMEAKGRKGDSMLVHMTADEVAGLQKLAESAGGSLSVNPETGLVEANFLKRMLPTLVGLGLAATGVGMPLAIAGGALTGGIQAKRNDQDVLAGAVMGGLGAYGGASLAGGLTAAGTQAAQATAMGKEAALQGATQATTAVPGAAASQGAAAPSAAEAMTRFGVTPANSPLAASAPPVTPPVAPVAPVGTETGAQAIEQAGMRAGEDYLAQGATDRLGGGLQALTDTGSNVGRNAFTQQFGMKQAMAGAAPLLTPEKIEEEELKEDDEMYYTEYTPGQTGERSSTSTEARQFESRYSPMERIKADDYMERRNRRYAAEGGLMRLAEGGVTNAAPAGNSGASADAMSYLMGQSPSATGAPSASQAGLQYLMGQTSQSPVMQAAAARQAQVGNFVAPERSLGGDISDTKGYTEITEGPNAGMYQGEAKFAFDPASQKYYRTDQLFKYVEPAPEPAYDPSYYGGNAAGGLLSLAKGGMKSGGFVIPADVVSMVGEGNTDAGYSRIKSMVPGATAIKGKDGGQADTVKTSIEGKQPARVAHGEMYVPPETVKRMGGAKKLYAMMDKVRAQATGSKKQIKPVSLKRALA
jgi:hypothetical protein